MILSSLSFELYLSIIYFSLRFLFLFFPQIQHCCRHKTTYPSIIFSLNSSLNGSYSSLGPPSTYQKHPWIRCMAHNHLCQILKHSSILFTWTKFRCCIIKFSLYTLPLNFLQYLWNLYYVLFPVLVLQFTTSIYALCILWIKYST